MRYLYVLPILFLVPFLAEGYNENNYYSESTYYVQSTYYSQSAYAPNITFTTPLTFGGNLTVTGNISKGSGTFVIDHPLDPKNKLLYHSFVESPDVKNIYDGIATINTSGEVVIALPRYFEALNKDFRYQVKPIDRSMPNLYIKEEIRNNRFTLGGGVPGGRVSWQVTGIRHDPYILKHPIVVEVEKGPGALVKRGEYLLPDVYGESSLFKRIGAIFGTLFSSDSR